MIGSILVGKKPLVTVGTTATVPHIAALLHEHRIGAVLVIDADHPDQIAGVVSERDICRCLHTHGRAMHEETAQDVMSSPVTVVDARASVSDAMAIMTDGRFRHLPVMDDGRLVGLVSIGDLVKRRIEDAEAEADSLKHYIAS